MKNIVNSELLNSFANLLLNNGYTLIVRPLENDPTWLYFSLDNKIGYVQLDYWHDRLSFSTVHKPCKDFGTGFGLHLPYEGAVNPTLQDAQNAFKLATNAFANHNLKGVVKYSSVEEFLKHSCNLWANYQVINK